MTKVELEILLKILHNTERIMASFAEFKVLVEGLIAAIEAFITKVSGEELVDPADMAAAVTEVQAEIDKIKSLP